MSCSCWEDFFFWSGEKTFVFLSNSKKSILLFTLVVAGIDRARLAVSLYIN